MTKEEYQKFLRDNSELLKEIDDALSNTPEVAAKNLLKILVRYKGEKKQMVMTAILEKVLCFGMLLAEKD